MEGRLPFFEPETLHTLPCIRETKKHLLVELNMNKEKLTCALKLSTPAVK